VDLSKLGELVGGEGLAEEGYGSYIEFLTHNYLCLVNVLGSIGPFQLCYLVQMKVKVDFCSFCVMVT